MSYSKYIAKLLAVKVSFDFDDTLTTQHGFDLAKRAINSGDDVHIVTRRQESASGPVYKVADELGIPHSKVHFTNGSLKWETIKRLGILKHYDNNQNELDKIQENVPGVDVVKLDTGVSIGSSYSGQFGNEND
jgi:hypothetical protein